MKAFITGSRAYGNVKPNSDIDLVIRVDPETKKLLWKLSQDKTKVLFGKLNLILCETDEEYEVWKLGTARMVRDAKKGIRRDKVAATAILDEYREKFKVADKADSGGDTPDEEEVRWYDWLRRTGRSQKFIHEADDQEWDDYLSDRGWRREEETGELLF